LAAEYQEDDGAMGFDSDSRTDLLTATPDELGRMLQEMGYRAFRGQQLFKWLHSGVSDFHDMTTLPKDLRTALAAEAQITALKTVKIKESGEDGTRKYLFRLEDENTVESVLMRYRHGNSACLSTQVGCKMGCTFCASTIGGLVRNLTAGEMIAQVLEINRDLLKTDKDFLNTDRDLQTTDRDLLKANRDVSEAGGEKPSDSVSHIVLMGMGEPLDNYRQVIRFLELVNHPDGLNVGMRRITLSTSGLIPEIRDLASRKLQITLAVSLHAPNSRIRQKIMPIDRTHPMDELLDACRFYAGHTRRRITFEYALLKGINDQREHAVELASKLVDVLCHVNVIPYNRVEDRPFETVDRQQADSFARLLSSKGVTATVRRELGGDINAACGQLRRREESRQRK